MENTMFIKSAMSTAAPSEKELVESFNALVPPPLSDDELDDLTTTKTGLVALARFNEMRKTLLEANKTIARFTIDSVKNVDQVQESNINAEVMKVVFALSKLFEYKTFVKKFLSEEGFHVDDVPSALLEAFVYIKDPSRCISLKEKFSECLGIIHAFDEESSGVTLLALGGLEKEHLLSGLKKLIDRPALYEEMLVKKLKPGALERVTKKHEESSRR